MSRGREYRLQLQGRLTDNVDELVAETEKIDAALDAYGLKAIGYDPGVLVRDALSDEYRKPFDLPIWFLKRLIEKDEEKNRLREAIGIAEEDQRIRETFVKEFGGPNPYYKCTVCNEIEPGLREYLLAHVRKHQ